jgi:hypothetical protein
MSWNVSVCQTLSCDPAGIPILALLQPRYFIFFSLKNQFDRIRSTVLVQFFSVFIFQQLPAFRSFYDRDHLCLLDQSAGHLNHLPFPDMREFDQEIANEIPDWVELPPCPHCDPVLLRGWQHIFYCQPFVDRICVNLPLPMDKQLLDRIVQLTHSHRNFSPILNRDMRPVLQHACVSSSNAGASNLCISGSLMLWTLAINPPLLFMLFPFGHISAF